MSDDRYFYPPESNEPSVDELIAEARAQMESAPGELPIEETTRPVEQPSLTPDSSFADNFVPDFGSAFDDYGEYVEPEQEEPEDDFDEPAPPTKPKRKRKLRLVPTFVKVILYVVICGLISVGLGFGIWECAQDVLAFGRSTESVTVSIDESDTVEDIAQILKDKGLIKYPWLFKLYCKFTDSAETMDPGTYTLCYNYDYHAIINGMIANSLNRNTVRVMIPEGYTCSQIFNLLESNGVCTADELAQCAAEEEFDYWFLADLSYGAENRLEGFLFPDTYDFYENDDPARVLDKLLTNFNKKFSEQAVEQLDALNDALAQRLANAGYDETYIAEHRFTIFELITVASMIEKETAGAEESVNIASVIYNRLCEPANFPYLNIDATVVYAHGGVSGALTYEDTQVDSPYNTYTHGGLPAGPISNPGLSSITAALNPAETNYHYYALDNSTMKHHFTETYDEHIRFLEGQNSGD